MKKLISVILPTRKRFDSLRNLLDSIIDKCYDIESIEILLKIDSDDVETIEKLKSYKRTDLIKTIISERKMGYSSLNDYYNELYEKSTGEFIFCVNDDITIETNSWDLLVKKYSGNLVCLHHNPTLPHNDCWYFPIVSKEILDVIGCVSKSVFYDGYLYFMLEDLNIFKRIDITINHNSLSDELTSEKNEVIEKFKSSEWEFDTKRELMMKDRDKVVEYLKMKNLIN